MVPVENDPLDQVGAVAHQDPIVALEAVTSLRDWLDEQEVELVARARGKGWSWVEIARALGRLKQAVWERHNETSKVADR